MAVGTQFGPYTLRRKLARGGMADIFVATRRLDEGRELCVIKMMIPSTLRNPRALKLFLGEARLAAQLDHPNIVRILDRDRVDDYYFIAMEYIPGETLYHIIHQAAHTGRRVTKAEAAATILQACDGLAYAHAMTDGGGRPLNIVHRDISPSNLILSYEGQVKILDFGIAAADTRRIKFPKGKAIGKYGYMSPEQCRGEDVDQRSDIFSLGVVFWELLTGASLFPGSDPQAIMASILSGDVSPPSSVRADVEPELERVVMGALSPNPKDRYQSARQMAQAIREVTFDDRMPGDDDLAAMLVDLFGKRRARLSRNGDVGRELELATLLFDDLDAEPPTRSEPSQEVRALPRSALSKTTITLLAVVMLLLAGALGFAAWVGRSAPKDFVAGPKKPPPTGQVQVDSTPPGANILINGAELGMKTPATLEGLPIDQDLKFTLSKPGFTPWTGRVRLEDVSLRRINAILIEAEGRGRPGRKRQR